MNFCPKCGCLLIPHKTKDKLIVKCKCGYKTETDEVIITEKIEKKKDIEIIDEEQEKTHPIIDIECPKCGHDKAEFWTRQTRSADEAETRFFKCVKCGHTWREYS